MPSLALPEVPFPVNQFGAPAAWFLSRVVPFEAAIAESFDKIVTVVGTDGTQYAPLFSDQEHASEWILDSMATEEDSNQPIHAYDVKSRFDFLALLRWLLSVGVTHVAFDPEARYGIMYPIDGVISAFGSSQEMARVLSRCGDRPDNCPD